MKQIIVGIGGFLRDAACCVIRDGRIASAVDQGKLARRASLAWFPEEAFATALQVADVQPDQIDILAVAR
ncbi:MAG TPA: carbamoyltransferase, partial [Bryobacteraceae bacterium]|nr:carbamoyltransferase [Bryobacteraceae bacterium]